MNGRGFAVSVFAVVWLLFCAPAFAACNHTVTAPWTSAKAFGLQLVATSIGVRCGKTAVVLSVADAKGTVLWTQALLAQQVSIFSADGVDSDKAVKATLKQWLQIGQRGPRVTTNMLPDWKAGAAEPTPEGEFGYVAGENLSREFYLEQRDKNRPLFCFVQGIESEGCIIAIDGASVQEFGGTRFPG
jgi:hypothetical protein